FHPGRGWRRCCAARRDQPWWNRHHVRRGVDDFMVQTHSRQERFAQGRRQRRSGGRRLMRSRLVLSLAVLAVFSTATGLRSEDAPPQTCDVPVSLLATESPLNKVADAVKASRALDVLVIGSRSSTIVSSDSSAYPARLVAALKERMPQLTVNFSVEIQARRTA